jgi:hypothetical protein
MGVCPFSGGAATVAETSVSRRRVLAGAAGLAVVPVLAGIAPASAAPVVPAPVPTPTPTTAPPAALAKLQKGRAAKGAHGVGDPRGSDIAIKLGRDREARFGLMFKRLPGVQPAGRPAHRACVKMNDGKAPLQRRQGQRRRLRQRDHAGRLHLLRPVRRPRHDARQDAADAAEAGPPGDGQLRHPEFDLGSVYGKGPTGSPELYDPAKPGYLLVNPHDELFDLPRDGVGAAYLGDPRNDENLIVAQLHVVFLRMHNKQLGRRQDLRAGPAAAALDLPVPDRQRLPAADRRPGRRHSLIRRRGTGPIQFTGKLYQPRNVNKPYMPVEYSGAAYRFGHSMIRAEYEVQDGHTVPIFGQDGYEDLRGNRPIPPTLWIDWNYFFEIPGMNTPDDRNMARLIDTQLSLPLSKLPSTVVAPTAGAIVALAERNLLRGKRLGLPAARTSPPPWGSRR